MASPARQEHKSNSKLPHQNFPVRENPPPWEAATRLLLRWLERQIPEFPFKAPKPIPACDRTFFSRPRKRLRYNDDVYMGPYKPDVLHFAGGRREGIHEPMGDCRNCEHHVRDALKERFPLSHVTPLPAETRESAAFIRDNPPGAIIKVWDAHPSALDELAQGCKVA